MQRGFTIAELIVIVGVISILASITIGSMTNVRAKGRDATRLSDLKKLQVALELYYDENREFPQYNAARTGWDGDANAPIECSPSVFTFTNNGTTDQRWCDLMTDLEPYLTAPLMEPSGIEGVNGAQYRYYYDAPTSNTNVYGAMIRLEHASNYGKANTDGGYYPTAGHSQATGAYYEVGFTPEFCQGKYNAADAHPHPQASNWWTGFNTVCYNQD